MWYSALVSVWLGATTMLSPVWMPMGSTFSMLQTVMQLSWPSRTTSYSISFQPSRYSSTRIWLAVGQGLLGELGHLARRRQQTPEPEAARGRSETRIITGKAELAARIRTASACVADGHTARHLDVDLRQAAG